MSDKVILYCETVPEGFRDLVKSLCPPGFDLRFLFPGGTDKQGKIEDADYIIAIDEEKLRPSLEKLHEAAYSEDKKIRNYVKELVPEYTIQQNSNIINYTKKATSIKNVSKGASVLNE